MSALTVTDTLSVPEALAVVRDILAQTDGDAVVLAHVERHAFPYVWKPARADGYPACHGERYSSRGPVGRFGLGALTNRDGKPTPYWWELCDAAYDEPISDPYDRTRGFGFTEAEVIEALDAALTALGWHCVGAP